MRINQYLAKATGMSRRGADEAIAEGRVTINDKVVTLGSTVGTNDTVFLDGNTVSLAAQTTTIMLNKPVGYVCSREGQGSKTVYDLLPEDLHNLKPVGRLDKDSSGLLLLTNDGELANKLTHPRYNKEKVYEVGLDKNLAKPDRRAIEEGVQLNDGPSKLGLSGEGPKWTVTMSEGRNRQIRRTFDALGYTVKKLHRTNFGDYGLDDLDQGKYKII